MGLSHGQHGCEQPWECASCSFSLTGFNLVVYPRRPFKAIRPGSNEMTLQVEWLQSASDRSKLVQILINPDSKGYKSKLSENVASLYDVVEVTFCERSTRSWRLAVYDVTFPWPTGYEVYCRPEDNSSTAFDLCREENDSLIFVQAPRTLPEASRLVAEDQKVVDVSGDDYVELAYTREGCEWRQFHRVLRDQAMIVSGQCRLSARENLKRDFDVFWENAETDTPSPDP